MLGENHKPLTGNSFIFVELLLFEISEYIASKKYFRCTVFVL